MKRLRVATGLHLEAAQIQWMEQSKVESIRERMFCLMLQKGVPFWGPGFACPRSGLFDPSELILGNAGVNIQNAPSGQCDWLKVVLGKTPRTIRVLPGVAYEKFGERITVPEISGEIAVPSTPGTYNVILQYATKTAEESDWWPGTPNDPDDILYKETDYYNVVVTSNPPGDSEVKIAEIEVAEDGTFEIIDKRDEAVMKLRFNKVPFHRHYKADVVDFDHTHLIKKEQYSNFYQPFWDTAYKMPEGYWYIAQDGSFTSFNFYFYGTKWFKGASFWAKWKADFDGNESYTYTYVFTLKIYPPGQENPIIELINNEITFQSSTDEPETVVDIDPYDASSFNEGWWRVEVIGSNWTVHICLLYTSPSPRD